MQLTVIVWQIQKCTADTRNSNPKNFLSFAGRKKLQKLFDMMRVLLHLFFLLGNRDYDKKVSISRGCVNLEPHLRSPWSALPRWRLPPGSRISSSLSCLTRSDSGQVCWLGSGGKNVWGKETFDLNSIKKVNNAWTMSIVHFEWNGKLKFFFITKL